MSQTVHVEQMRVFDDNLGQFFRYFSTKKHMLWVLIRITSPCGYSLKSPRWGDSNESPQHMFFMENYKKLSLSANILLICSTGKLSNIENTHWRVGINNGNSQPDRISNRMSFENCCGHGWICHLRDLQVTINGKCDICQSCCFHIIFHFYQEL